MSQVATPQNADSLSPILSERFALRRSHVVVAALLATACLYFNYIPVFHSDIWGHVSYGEWILQHRSLPTEDPFVELAAGVPITCTAWLSQVIFGAAHQTGGVEWISHVFALTVLATLVVLARALYLLTSNIGCTIAALGLVCVTVFNRHAIVRPEIFGAFCFALLLLMLIHRRMSDARPATAARFTACCFGTALLFAAWANLHGSFVVGFAVLGAEFGGRVIERVSSTRKLSSVFTDGEAWRLLILLEVAAVATLLNPYGIDLLIHTLLFPSNPNLKDVLEWFSLEMVSYEGIQIGFSWVVLVVVLRHSRAPMRPADVLMLAIFTLATVLRVRMQTWYGPVFAVVIAPHLMDIARRHAPRWVQNESPRSFANTLIACLIVWVCFAFSPLSQPVLGGDIRSKEQALSRGTPIALTEWLKEHPPVGRVANPQWWGDWLAEFGPPDLQVFMTTNAVHAAPQRVWKDYLLLARAEAPIDGLLDRYRINTIIVHKELQALLDRRIRRMPGWRVVYEDDLGLVASRIHSPLNDASTGIRHGQ